MSDKLVKPTAWERATESTRRIGVATEIVNKSVFLLRIARDLQTVFAELATPDNEMLDALDDTIKIVSDRRNKYERWLTINTPKHEALMSSLTETDTQNA